MKKTSISIYIAIVILISFSSNIRAQEVKEIIQPLSSKSTKGYLFSYSKDEAGTSTITYKIPGAKKSNEIFFEEYTFDSDLKFLGSKPVQEQKTEHADVEKTSFFAYVGGTTSFDVANMKLKLNKVVALETWSPERKSYITKKVISRETIKAKNDVGKVYLGYASYQPSDYKDKIFVISRIDSKDKGTADKFMILLFDETLEIKEQILDLNGSYSLVFCNQMSNDDVVMVFAPKSGASDISKYVYYQYDIKGNLKNRVEFKSPASAMLLTAAYDKDGSIYFCGSSMKSTESYEDVFKEYAPIYNPGITPGGANVKDIKWQKAAGEKMENFHLLKFTGNILTFVSTTPVSAFKAKFKTSTLDKGASPYKGSKFAIRQFYVTPAGDYLITGQLSNTVNMGSEISSVKSYEDIVCLHFDKTGALKAQYGVGKMNNDKKSEIFEMPQAFYLSADGKKVFWEILEVKGTKGYESFLEAYYGYPSFYALYFPRIGVIDLENSTVSNFKVLGNEKYFVRNNFTGIFDANENSINYLGHDEDFKQLWLGKVLLN